ncbi:MAG: hypothetical protein KGL43_10465 [Burkholderiales bacterium]|nr:hypothetical protein [Burkholderiales bacterium]MDE2394216.1 hypothetical protein [Burkholderiales bacterium]MDE2454007.1 hypothetical protein [Burkholderiales bacterium]
MRRHCSRRSARRANPASARHRAFAAWAFPCPDPRVLIIAAPSPIWRFTITAQSTPNKPAAKKRAPSAAFAKPMTPSPALAAVIGAEAVARTEVVKRLWVYIKANNLQDANKRTLINADAKLQPVFGKDQVTMFEMTKLVSAHLS